ncbi:MAG: ABC transporter permease [Christensenellales bacterium]
MRTLFLLTKRNIKLFFKDKGMFFSSLITPLILLLLYATFLAKVYRDSFVASLPDGFVLADSVINATVGGQLLASLLAVSCITVAFCSNLIMIKDKVTGAYKDFAVSPLKSKTISVAYYLGTLFNTLIVCFVALAVGLVYIAITGWYFTFVDVLLLILDVILLTMFGTALSSIINSFLKTQGQMSAVGTIVSSCYGFICGAYMPISNFGTGLQHILSLLPGTYGTAIIKNHSLNGAFAELAKQGVPTNVIEEMKTALDCNISFFGNNVSMGAMYGILIGTIVVLMGVYVLINFLRRKRI